MINMTVLGETDAKSFIAQAVNPKNIFQWIHDPLKRGSSVHDSFLCLCRKSFGG